MTYVEEELSERETSSLKLADLVKMYDERVAQLEGSVQSHVHSTRMKEKLLAHCRFTGTHKR